jgi:hypothetical protein
LISLSTAVRACSMGFACFWPWAGAVEVPSSPSADESADIAIKPPTSAATLMKRRGRPTEARGRALVSGGGRHCRCAIPTSWWRDSILRDVTGFAGTAFSHSIWTCDRQEPAICNAASVGAASAGGETISASEDDLLILIKKQPSAGTNVHRSKFGEYREGVPHGFSR